MKECDSIEPAREFLLAHGGGIIEKRGVKTLKHSGFGLERVAFDPPLKERAWRLIERITGG